MVEPHLWALASAAEQAFPLLMGPTMQTVRTACPDAQQQQHSTVHLWLLQVCHSSVQLLPQLHVSQGTADLDAQEECMEKLCLYGCTYTPANLRVCCCCCSCSTLLLTALQGPQSDDCWNDLDPALAGSQGWHPGSIGGQAAEPASAAGCIPGQGTGQRQGPSRSLPGCRAAAAGAAFPDLSPPRHPKSRLQPCFGRWCQDLAESLVLRLL